MAIWPGVNTVFSPILAAMNHPEPMAQIARIPLHEEVTNRIRDMIARNPNVTEFRRLCRERGMVTLREDGLKKVSDGLTTIEEVLRVTVMDMM